MGTDKAELIFDGRTMLEIAHASMGTVSDEVAVVGTGDRPLAGAACILDTYPGCGPMGGMEAALRDCRKHAAEFAVFLPVDVPLLPGGLLRALTDVWTASEAVRVAVAVADGRVQPLISMIHVDVQATLAAALERGDHKLQPALRAAAQSLAEPLRAPLDSVFFATSLTFGARVVITSSGVELAWTPTAAEWESRGAWFANLNTPKDLQEALERRRKTADEMRPPVAEHLI